MKRLFGNFASVLSSLLVTFTLAHAAQLQEARVTQVVSDVKLLPQQAAPRPAAMNDPVREGTAVRTGTQSRSELTFADQTITRLGANTIFSVNRGTRVMNLGEGAMLFQVPKGSGGATVKTAAITAAITGTTGIGENHSATAENPKPVIKWFCLEGKIVLMLTNGSDESVELLAGQMIVTDGTYLPRPMFFDIGAMVASSRFFPAIHSHRLSGWDLIRAEIQNSPKRGLLEAHRDDEHSMLLSTRRSSSAPSIREWPRNWRHRRQTSPLHPHANTFHTDAQHLHARHQLRRPLLR